VIAPGAAYYTVLMRVHLALLSLCVVAATTTAAGQTRKAPARPPASPALTKEAPEMRCPALLGTGVATKLTFCDVLTGRDPSEGILITVPPHKGDVTLTFDLHNRHTYSEEQGKEPRAAYARYTATIGALTLDNTLISRAAVQSEFRVVGDLFDRIAGGAGLSGLKAVAPTGVESVTLTIPEAENQVSVLGEKLTVERAGGSATYTSAGRPIAVISNVMLEYRPLPPPRPAAPARPAAAKPPPKTPAKPSAKPPASGSPR